MAGEVIILNQLLIVNCEVEVKGMNCQEPSRKLRQEVLCFNKFQRVNEEQTRVWYAFFAPHELQEFGEE